MTLHARLAAVRGAVTHPDDPGYETARHAWQLGVDQRPAAVVVPADERDVAIVLDACRAEGVTATVQTTGHGAGDPLHGVVVLRMSAFDRCEVDVPDRIARVGAGVTVGRLAAALDGTALVGPAGTSRLVTVAGLTLGGGHGWFTRLAGLGAQRLRRVRVVLADGTARWIDDDDPALMAVVRGAGGLLGVVTELEVELTPVARLRGGALEVAASDAAAVLRACRALAADAPHGLALSVTSRRMPDAPMLPAAIRGRSWCSVEVVLADVDDAVLDPVRQAAPLLADSVRDVRPSELHTIANDPEEPGAAVGWSTLLWDVDDALAERLAAFHASDAAAPLVGIQLRVLGGTAPERPSIVGTGDARWLLYAIAPVLPGTSAEAAVAALAALRDVVGDAATGVALPTFLGEGEDLSRSLDAAGIAAIHAARARLGADVIAPLRLPPAAAPPATATAGRASAAGARA